jgi:cyclohexanone monooxygenase
MAVGNETSGGPGVDAPDLDAPDLDAVVVGAGFAGLYMLHRLREFGFSARVYEAGSGVGGTWYWNRYPGARCDIESMEYSFQFSPELQQDWEWSERYAGQPEILRYAEHVADRFDLTRDIVFDTRVTAATFDETRELWSICTDNGRSGDGRSERQVTARFLIMATGCLSSARIPDFEGIERFTGATYHTGRWPHEPVDFTGQRVGVIGTGSSGVQSIPVIAEQASQLFVFQRTPAVSVPAHNAPLDPDEQAAIKADYAAMRARDRAMVSAFGSRTPPNDVPAMSVSSEERTEVYEDRWANGGLTFLGAFNDILLDPTANESASEFIRAKVLETVDDPEVAACLVPTTVVGCKRLCVDTGYYEAFNRPNVTLVDVGAAPIEEITPSGLRAGGVDYDLDCIVFATGFDAMTGALVAVDIRGRDGRSLRDAWADGPRAYLGLAVAGFPNLFTITGPGSPSVLTNMIVSIEQHVEWITDCLAYLREHGFTTVEATPGAQDEWVAYVGAVADITLFPRCNSWYVGANVPGKPRIFMPLVGFPPYVEKCQDVAAKGYEGFVLSGGASG